MSLGNSNFGKIAAGWAIITVSGIYAFVLSKNSVDKQRIDSMKVRDRMRKSNYGEYEESDRKIFKS